jgi:hypothetical protein
LTEENNDGSKKNAKNKKGGEERSLPSNSHFCHHLEAPLAGALFKLLAFEAPINFALLGWKLWRWK